MFVRIEASRLMLSYGDSLGMVGMFISGARQGALTDLTEIHSCPKSVLLWKTTNDSTKAEFLLI